MSPSAPDSPSMPWFRVPEVWLILFLLGATVIGSFALLAEAIDTPVGLIPAPEAIDITGLDMSVEQVAKALEVDPQEWQAEVALIDDWFAKIGDTMPSQLKDELATLKAHLDA